MTDFMKCDLHPGYIVRTRDGYSYDVHVLEEGNSLVLTRVRNGVRIVVSLDHFTDDLRADGFGPSDICQVKGYTHVTSNGALFHPVIWERKEVKEVTMAEVCEKFGCDVKIVEG